MVSPFWGTVGPLDSVSRDADATGAMEGLDFVAVVLERSTVARGGPGGSSMSVTTEVLSARMRVLDHLEQIYLNKLFLQQ